MSQEQPIAGNEVTARRQISIPFGQVAGSQALKVIGLPELVGLLAAALIAITVIFAYLYFYLPANSRRVSLELERTTLQGDIQAVHTQVGEGENTRDKVARISASLEDFESNSLPSESSGRLSLYTVLNNLIKTNRLRNTAGPSYAPLEIVGTKTQVQPGISAEKQATAKWQSIYPGIAVSVTVEGYYPDIRHFVRDIETSKQFLIVNAIELEGVKESGAAAAQDQTTTIAKQSAPPTTVKNQKAPSVTATPPAPEIEGGRGGFVSLRLDIATYFRRPDA